MNKAAKAALFLRSLGAEQHDEIKALLALSGKDEAFLLGEFLKINKAKTKEEWLAIGKALHERFVKEESGSKAKKKAAKASSGESGEGEGDEGEEGESEGSTTEIGKGNRKPPKVRQANKEFNTKTARIPLEKRDDSFEQHEEMMREVSELEELAPILDPKVLQCPSVPDLRYIVSAAAKEEAVWGTMGIVTCQLNRAVSLRRIIKGTRPGYVGALRYTHRLSTDGMVFGLKKFVPGGTILIDCSGSMAIGPSDIEAFLDERPHATIALYGARYCYPNSMPAGATNGSLLIISRNGRQIDTQKLRELMGQYFSGWNVVDGMALRWLSRQPGEKFWICDGFVTGLSDKRHIGLNLDAAKVQAKARIKRYENIQDFLDKKPARTGLTTQ